MSSRTIYALTAGQKPVVITNHFYMRPDIKESLCTQFFFWCIMDEKEGPILVDQSFTQRCLDDMKIPYQVKEGPLELLDRIGVRPEDVRHVILSHLHWDHYAGDEFYPNARYHVHQKELEYVTGPLMRFTTYAQHYNFKAIEHLLHLHFSGRVHLIQDEREEICEGITCLRTGGHTPGLMSVAVETTGGTKVICSDVVPRYRNISEMTPCGIHYDVTEALQALETVSRMTRSVDDILPGHDPAITERYPQVAPGAFRII